MYIAGRHGLSAKEALASSAMPWLTLCGRVLGGKGGFGSTLRSQGNKMSKKKAANYDNCRDSYGRRLKTLKDAKAMVDKAEMAEKAMEEARERRRKKIADGLMEKPAKKHRFDDVDYINESEEVVEATKAIARRALRTAAKSRGKGEIKDESRSSDRDLAATGSQTSGRGLAVPLFDGCVDELSSSSSDSEGSDLDNRDPEDADPPQPDTKK
ncbi:hypothetical protein LPJ56_005720 [Coemansia sp. RSA 2599]|nr:hypothetical protein LPJ56_005720 [Coemansia sp. RSA 2599]